MKKTLRNNKGFTLIELLAVIVIIAILGTAIGSLIIGYINQSDADTFYNSAVSVKNAAQMMCLNNEEITTDSIKNYLGTEESKSFDNGNITIESADKNKIKVKSKKTMKKKHNKMGNYFKYASDADISTIEITGFCE